MVWAQAAFLEAPERFVRRSSDGSSGVRQAGGSELRRSESGPEPSTQRAPDPLPVVVADRPEHALRVPDQLRVECRRDAGCPAEEFPFSSSVAFDAHSVAKDFPISSADGAADAVVVPIRHTSRH
jgi:hypothetical protein